MDFFKDKQADTHETPSSQLGTTLDEEMEKVFASPEVKGFDVAQLSGGGQEGPASERRRFGEKDYVSHRKESFPHSHHPLKPLRSSRKRLASPKLSDSEGTESGDGGIAASSLSPQQSPETTPSHAPEWSSPEPDESQDAEESESSPLLVQQQQPVVSPSSILKPSGSAVVVQLASGEEDDEDVFSLEMPESPTKRVQFQVGAEAPGEGEGHPHKKRHGRHHHHHHGHHHHHHHHHWRDKAEDPQSRVRLGSELGDGDLNKRVATEEEEAAMLEGYDLDDLASHRFEDAKGLRRPRFFPHHRSSATGATVLRDLSPRRVSRKGVPGAVPVRMWDRKPHEMLVELDELLGDEESRQWRETGRWIKYEEDLEEGAHRWGKPHVATLSFHSLLNLRRLLEAGVMLLDLEEKDLAGVSYRVVEALVTEEHIGGNEKGEVMRVLTLRHKHVDEHDGRFRFLRRSHSSIGSVQSLDEKPSKPKTVSSLPAMTEGNGLSRRMSNHSNHVDGETTVSVEGGPSPEPPHQHAEEHKKLHKENIMRRIPLDAQATSVLVGSVDFLDKPFMAFVRLAEGVLMPHITEVPIPVRFVFILMGPPHADLDYHELGRSVATLMSNRQFRETAYKLDDRRDLLSSINEFLDDSIVVPPGEWDSTTLLPIQEMKNKVEAIRERKKARIRKLIMRTTPAAPPESVDDEVSVSVKKVRDPLQRTKRLFGGLINDIRQRYPLYKSDITDGFDSLCLATTVFIFFAALSGAVTFGGLMAQKTDDLIGISETLVSTSAAGVIFALLSGQPLIIVGTTGPLLLFDESLFSFCEMSGLEFLSMRVWIGIWLAIIGLVMVAVEGSLLVRLFSRFTQEIFAALISLLYIWESLISLFQIFKDNPLLADYCFGHFIFGNFTLIPEDQQEKIGTITLAQNETWVDVSPARHKDMGVNQPNTALLSTILMLGTFFIAYFLRHFRNSSFLGRSARRALGDFGVPIAIVVMAGLDYAIPDTYTTKLNVPEGLTPSDASVRGWLISPLGQTGRPMPVWMPFAACIPALLIFILAFMETEICELIVSKKERKLRKGSGFHLDILILCLINLGCGFMGAPWICAATVRSVSHVSALSVWSTTHAPGEKPKLVEVKEQRVTALAVSILVGLSVLMSPLLRLVPISVLFGVFLYMGVASMNGIQLFERMQLLLKPTKHHPQVGYVRKVETWKMHLFTVIQIICLAMLWVVKSVGQVSLAFPFFLLLMVPLRAHLLKCFFSPTELRALDNAEVDDVEVTDEPDFYVQAHMPG